MGGPESTVEIRRSCLYTKTTERTCRFGRVDSITVADDNHHLGIANTNLLVDRYYPSLCLARAQALKNPIAAMSTRWPFESVMLSMKSVSLALVSRFALRRSSVLPHSSPSRTLAVDVGIPQSTVDVCQWNVTTHAQCSKRSHYSPLPVFFPRLKLLLQFLDDIWLPDEERKQEDRDQNGEDANYDGNLCVAHFECVC